MSEVENLPEADKILELPISYEEKGKEIGREEGVKRVALAMLKKGTDIDFIAEVTRLDIEEIKKLKEQLYFFRGMSIGSQLTNNRDDSL